MRTIFVLFVALTVAGCASLKNGPSSPDNALAIGHFTMLDKDYKITSINLFRVVGAFGDYATAVTYPDGSFCFLDLKPGKYEVTSIVLETSTFGIPTGKLTVMLRDLFTAQWVFEVKPREVINVGSYSMQITQGFLLGGYNAKIETISSYDHCCPVEFYRYAMI